MIIDLNKNYNDKKRTTIRNLLRDICKQNKIDFANISKGFTVAAIWNAPNCAVRVYKVENGNYIALDGLPILILFLEERGTEYEVRLLHKPNLKQIKILEKLK